MLHGARVSCAAAAALLYMVRWGASSHGSASPHTCFAVRTTAGTRSLAVLAGSNSLVKSGRVGAAGSTIMPASTAAARARHQDLLRVVSSGDAALLIGGDLNVTVVQAQVGRRPRRVGAPRARAQLWLRVAWRATPNPSPPATPRPSPAPRPARSQGLSGNTKNTHSFARIYVAEPFPTNPEEDRAKQTSVVWQSCDPLWDEQLVFRDVCAASELHVELWDLGGTRSGKQLNKLTQNPSGERRQRASGGAGAVLCAGPASTTSPRDLRAPPPPRRRPHPRVRAEVIKSCRFLGRAEVALGTLSGVPAGTPLWFALMRRGAGDTVR